MTSAAQLIDLAALRPGDPPVRVLGYPLEIVLRGEDGHRIRPRPRQHPSARLRHIYTLTGTRRLSHAAVREPLLVTARHCRIAIVALSTVIANLTELRAPVYTAYRCGLGPDAHDLPADFDTVVRAVARFADALADETLPSARWDQVTCGWTRRADDAAASSS